MEEQELPEPEYIIYEGKSYQIEWYYSEKGKSQPFEYYKKLDAADRKKALKLFQMLAEIGQIRNEEKFRNEGDKIYAFKPQPHRFLCFFFTGSKVIVTNAFVKKQQKLPKAEKERALRLKIDYENRNKKGTYYEEDEKNDDV
ncbi:type II toxin-antitoxin system RelE/ParE family toxin [Fulvivirgaceae bacterium BMA12]|uniref:Type II toxin-antitoxin system RelE/ParE family toxin n=1 Tax=Agaribacillus aureus TaxID=3051825 RepID=A0ABT8LFN4_9BACT|nr:type II toxin-antitoxin system RelE/ParE family toxin [Fulvivirgaceae bacterium BMA12]